MKFLAIITIAILLEALVSIFDAAKKDISLLVYPTFLLLAAVLLVISLGVYLKLSRGRNICRCKSVSEILAKDRITYSNSVIFYRFADFRLLWVVDKRLSPGSS